MTPIRFPLYTNTYDRLTSDRYVVLALRPCTVYLQIPERHSKYTVIYLNISTYHKLNRI
ncbi:hypothetical protein BT96DRAFT_989657 [Gymnopus androsaceus JB14]|uniref:Uncharacterized protein n=1 Tax=Gymnopus androsaceus JB14 TaxID=1447944 RepID=A0A6A4I5U8_9AGAR|nr:hypothetical protein BT96DRAFT_1008112 [Gymnopus androsaceus JB14]KAE9404174.1 hypothetical protein BT96DRAFT_989657 [Gymnopus androsaceus JB14]